MASNVSLSRHSNRLPMKAYLTCPPPDKSICEKERLELKGGTSLAALERWNGLPIRLLDFNSVFGRIRINQWP